MVVFEIKRDNTQQVTSVEELFADEEKDDKTIDTPLLDGFIQGFQTVMRTKFN